MPRLRPFIMQYYSNPILEQEHEISKNTQNPPEGSMHARTDARVRSRGANRGCAEIVTSARGTRA